MNDSGRLREHPALDIESVVAQIKQGDTESYAMILQRFQRPLYVYCYYLLANKEEAEDAVQDILIKGYQHIHRYSPAVSFSAWIYRIAYNHCINLSKKRSRTYRLLRAYQRQHTDKADQSYTDLVHELLESLTSAEKHILLLRAVEEYSFEEISGIMNLKPATIRKKYERLRKKLIRKKALGGQEYEAAYQTSKV